LSFFILFSPFSLSSNIIMNASGVAFCADQFLISVSIDQRIKVWRYEFKSADNNHERRETEISDCDQTDTASDLDQDSGKEEEEEFEISVSLVATAVTSISDVCGLNLVTTKDPNSR
jgi:hypothetical protein